MLNLNSHGIVRLINNVACFLSFNRRVTYGANSIAVHVKPILYLLFKEVTIYLVYIYISILSFN